MYFCVVYTAGVYYCTQYVCVSGIILYTVQYNIQYIVTVAAKNTRTYNSSLSARPSLRRLAGAPACLCRCAR